jgi:nanoRNase/pAp phosphatase (c-di-AMP/oligoRNAs hydrolase)
MKVEELRQLADALPETGKVILCTHRHPDPDGLGAIVGLEYLLKKRFKLEVDLVLEGRIRRAENVAMRDMLEIHSLPKGAVDPAEYAGILIVDSQPGFSHTNPPGAMPVLAVFDHHDGPKGEDANLADVPFVWVAPEYGATSTMIYDLLAAFGLEPDQRSATALFCGVRYDTNNLLRGATQRDEDAFRVLERLADRKIVGAIDQPPLPKNYFEQMHVALEACERYDNVLLTLLGEVSSPESVAEIADWFLRLEGQQWSLAGGACDGRYQVSLRTDMEDADAYPALRYLLGREGKCGGHGRMAGGQIPLTELSVREVQDMIRRRAVDLFGMEGREPEPLVSLWENQKPPR